MYERVEGRTLDLLVPSDSQPNGGLAGQPGDTDQYLQRDVGAVGDGGIDGANEIR